MLLDGNNLGDDLCRSLARSLASFVAIPGGIIIHFHDRALVSNRSVKKLSLSFASVSDKGGKSLLKYLARRRTKLVELNYSLGNRFR